MGEIYEFTRRTRIPSVGLTEETRKEFILKCLEIETKTLHRDLQNLDGEDLRIACVLLHLKQSLLEQMRGAEASAFTENLFRSITDYINGLYMAADNI